MAYLSDSERSRLLEEAEPQGREVGTQVGFQTKDDGRDARTVSLGHALVLSTGVSNIILEVQESSIVTLATDFRLRSSPMSTQMTTTSKDFMARGCV